MKLHELIIVALGLITIAAFVMFWLAVMLWGISRGIV